MLKHILFLLISMVSLSTLCAQSTPRDMQMKVDVAYLASDILAGRAAGSPFADEAAAYLAMRMRQLSLKPMGDKETYLQEFPIIVAGHGHMNDAPQLKTSNVLGYLDNKADQTIMIGAHYDHLGFGGSGSGSLHVGDPEPHNGADDNASGVAMVFDLAERLQQKGAKKKYNFLFVGWSAEEMGLIGSKFLAEHMPEGMPAVVAVINFDMVGRLSKENVLAVNGTGTSPVWPELLVSASKDRVTINSHESGLGPSDHASFYLQDLPVLHFFTGQHPQYHKPGDDIHLVNFPGMVTISDIVYDVVQGLPKSGQIPFTKTKDESMSKVSAFKVTMGVMPDYVYAGEGMRIDGVLDDRPAMKAGLERGDVLVELDGKPVGDIYDYMKYLGEHEKGDSVNIIVERKGEKLKKRITF
ncbi:MAG: M20/M25/M40 family metallo-hydrolase [Saprospiraceae bacterium]